MSNLTFRHVWSLKRRLVIPTLMRLDLIIPIGYVFRFIYQAIAKITALLLRQRGVKYIYLRRGLAKNEFMPFLSDIDVTVFIDTKTSKAAIQSRLERICRLIPVLESQSPIITISEFNEWLKPENFAQNRSFLYRIMEAPDTWKSLYAADIADPLAQIRTFTKNETIGVVFSEILFWHRIVISEYTLYYFSGHQPPCFAQRKRMCWILMKATTELYSFLQNLEDNGKLVYSRRQILEIAINDKTMDRWANLFKYNLMMLDNKFHSRRYDIYLSEAIACLSYLYNEFYIITRRILNEQPDLHHWLGNCSATSTGASLPEYNSVNLRLIPDLKLVDNGTIAAIYVTPHLRTNRQYKILVVVVLKSLTRFSTISVQKAMKIISAHLEPQNIRHDQIELNLVDHYGFKCFGIARQTGSREISALNGDNSYSPPTTYDLIFHFKPEIHE